MRTFALRSGSNGNAIFVEAGGVRLLIDAGISGLRAESCLREKGISIRDVDGVILTHDHRDHTSGAGVWQRVYGLPIHLTAGTEAGIRPFVGRVSDLRTFRAGDDLAFDGVRVRTIPTPHDAREAVAVIVDDGRRRIGILTDLGHPFPGLGEVVAQLDFAYIEANHDVAMLLEGPYPQPLKERIRGPAGHIANEEAADLLRRWAGPRLERIALAHLSQHNNTPELALETVRQRGPKALSIAVASRHGPTEIFEIE
ncbi:MAG: MBL fold metallo-hydrolase [Planctomycetes bacterium]|nr:MBL fold metallo-hydrolase [Planctomycetota bacterium]